MKKFWYAVLDRSLDSLSVWNLATGFSVGHLTLAQHSADTVLLSEHILQCAQAEDALHTARVGRDNLAASLRDLTTRACRLIAGTVAAGDAMAGKVDAVRRVRGQSFRALEDKGDKLVSAWTEINTYRAGLTPVLPALTVGTTTVVEVQSLLGNYRQLLANVSNKETPVSTKKALLRATVARVDKNNKRWYLAWQGQFAAGSPERAALSQVDTGASQSAPGQGVFLGVETLADQVVRLTFGAARATGFKLFHQGPGEEEFSVLAEELTVNTFEHAAGVAGAHTYKVAGLNGAGTGAESQPFVVAVPQAQAA